MCKEPENGVSLIKRNYHERCERIYWICSSIITIVATSGAVFAAFYAKGAYEQALRQANAAVETLEISQSERRPWIGVPEIKFDQWVVSASGGRQAAFKLSFPNVGKTFSLGTSVIARLVPGDEWEQVLIPLKEDGAREHDRPGHARYAAIPGAEFSAYEILDVNGPDPVGQTPRHLIGWVSYRWPGEKGLHQTGFVAPVTIDGKKVIVERAYALDPN